MKKDENLRWEIGHSENDYIRSEVIIFQMGNIVFDIKSGIKCDQNFEISCDIVIRGFIIQEASVVYGIKNISFAFLITPASFSSSQSPDKTIQ